MAGADAGPPAERVVLRWEAREIMSDTTATGRGRGRRQEPGVVAIHRIALRQDASRAEFERVMTEEVFPAAADAPGSVSRGGASAIRSQHLLRADGEENTYVWLVKSSGVFSQRQFSTVVDRMLQEQRASVETFGTIESSTVFVVVQSFDVGPRDTMGRPTGAPQRGTDI